MLEGLENRLLLSSSPTIYTVNSTGNDITGSGNSGTLPYVIGLANNDPNTAGSKIQFDKTVFASPQTITLSSTLVLSETAGPEVIDGPGAKRVTVSGNNSVEVFSVVSGVTATLTGLTISSGLASQGGGLSVDGDKVSLTNDVITNNQAVGAAGAAGGAGTSGGDGGDGLGGGIYLASGSLTLNNDVVSSNAARGGTGGAGGGGTSAFDRAGGSGGGGDRRPAPASMWLMALLSRTTTSSNRIKPSVARVGMEAMAPAAPRAVRAAPEALPRVVGCISRREG